MTYTTGSTISSAFICTLHQVRGNHFRTAKQTNKFADILASVIQGSAISSAFVVTAWPPASSRWQRDTVILSFADDTYGIVQAVNSDTSTSELTHQWAEDNNLKLNFSESKEILFAGRGAHVSAHMSVSRPSQYHFLFLAWTFAKYTVLVPIKLSIVFYTLVYISDCCIKVLKLSLWNYLSTGIATKCVQCYGTRL